MKIYSRIAVVVAMSFAAPALADMTGLTRTEKDQTLLPHSAERAITPSLRCLQAKVLSNGNPPTGDIRSGVGAASC